MWNWGATRFCPATMPTPMATCTNTDTWAAVVNHHSARVRSDGRRMAAIAHRPASPLPTITNHAQALCTASSEPSSTAPFTTTPATVRTSGRA